MGRAATRRLIYPTGQCKNPFPPLTNINFHQLQVGFHYKLCAESPNQQTATNHVCERPYNYFVCTLPKAATKTQESLIVILSTVIFSKRRKIKSFWIEPSVRVPNGPIDSDTSIQNRAFYGSEPRDSHSVTHTHLFCRAFITDTIARMFSANTWRDPFYYRPLDQWHR